MDLKQDAIEQVSLSGKLKGAANVDEEFAFTHEDLRDLEGYEEDESFIDMFGLERVSGISLPEDDIKDDGFGGSREGFGGALKPGVIPKMSPGFQG